MTIKKTHLCTATAINIPASNIPMLFSIIYFFSFSLSLSLPLSISLFLSSNSHFNHGNEKVFYFNLFSTGTLLVFPFNECTEKGNHTTPRGREGGYRLGFFCIGWRLYFFQFQLSCKTILVFHLQAYDSRSAAPNGFSCPINQRIRTSDTLKSDQFGENDIHVEFAEFALWLF